MSTVYVSSTFRDLQEHRKAVSLAIKRLGHADIAMEYYVSEDARPVDRCVLDAGSCDLYVGTFAHRYGFCPDGGEVSITELEFRAARRNGVDCLCFFVDEGADWPSDQIEHGVGARKLEELRAEIGEHYLAGFFATPDELGAIATASIARYFDLGPTPFDAMREHRLMKEFTAPTGLPRDRTRAAQALANMGSPRYVAEIKRRLLEADEAGDVTRIAHFLDELQRLAASRRELMPIFLDLLEEGGTTQRFFAVFQLGELALRGVSLEPAVIDELVKLADSPAPDVRRQLAHTLGKLTHTDKARPDVRRTLDRLVADAHEAVREMAVDSLGKLP